MEVKIKAMRFEATEALRTFIEKKTARLEKRFGEIQHFEVQLKVVKPATALNKQTSFTVTMPGGTFFIEKTCDTFEEGVDQCLKSLKTQLTKFKEKQRDR